MGRPFRILCVVAVTMMAMLTAVASPASAESTALCSSEEEECLALTHLHETSVGKAKLLASPQVECDVLFLGDATSSSGSPLAVEGSFSYSNCGSSCSAKEENGPTTIEILREGHELSKVTRGTGSGTGLVNVNCLGLQCKYVGSGLVGHGLGPLLSEQANGAVTIKEQAVSHESGFFCPSNAKLDITLTPLEKTYIIDPNSLNPKLCELGVRGKSLYTDFPCRTNQDDGLKLGDWELK